MQHWRMMITSTALAITSLFIQVKDILLERFLVCKVHAVHACNWDEFLDSLYAMVATLVDSV